MPVTASFWLNVFLVPEEGGCGHIQRQTDQEADMLQRPG